MTKPTRPVLFLGLPTDLDYYVESDSEHDGPPELDPERDVPDPARVASIWSAATRTEYPQVLLDRHDMVCRMPDGSDHADSAYLWALLVTAVCMNSPRREEVTMPDGSRWARVPM